MFASCPSSQGHTRQPVGTRRPARAALAGAVLAALAGVPAAVAGAAETLEGLKAEVEALKKRVDEATE